VETYLKDHHGNILVAYANDGIKDGFRQMIMGLGIMTRGLRIKVWMGVDPLAEKYQSIAINLTIL